jgi:hypothetical protein
MLQDKAPGPDGFATCFLHIAWDIIRPDIMKAFDAFWHFDTRSFHLLNDALMILLPKKANAATMRDYRPISLIHIVGKIFSKVLASRPAPRLDKMISINQSAMYADDLIMFASPMVNDMSMVRTIFHIFKGASCLSCNMAKCQLVPIWCSEDQIQAALASFPCQRVDFPITYLGMPLPVYKLPRSALQLIADKMASKLPA